MVTSGKQETEVLASSYSKIRAKNDTYLGKPERGYSLNNKMSIKNSVSSPINTVMSRKRPDLEEIEDYNDGLDDSDSETITLRYSKKGKGSPAHSP